MLASGIVPVERVDAAEIELQGTIEATAAPADVWDKGVADLLVRQGVLTRFQAREMLAGRRRFRLGHYTVLDEIGRGGMGQVFLAEHALMGRSVAIKVLPRSRSTPEYEAAFRREIRMLASLDHDNLVRALDAGYDAKVYYLVTEFVPGLDLRRQVRRYGPLEATVAGAVVTQAARGLAYAHEHGVVHRDVKPGNLLVTQDGRVKVLDLGLAGSAMDPETQQAGRVVGTMDYMAPEQIRAPESAGPAADVYALGCTLYFALSGQPPFPGGSRKEKAHRQLSEQPVPLQQLVPRIDPHLCRLVEAMMRKSSAERIGSAREVIERLRPWTPSAPVSMPRSPLPGVGAGVGQEGGAEAGRGSSLDMQPPALDLLGGRDRSTGHSGTRSGTRSADGSRAEKLVTAVPAGPPPVPPSVPPAFAEAPLVVATTTRPERSRDRRRQPGSVVALLSGRAAVPLAIGGAVCGVAVVARAVERTPLQPVFGPVVTSVLLGLVAGLLAALAVRGQRHP